jgi:hypothetical protein
MNVAFQWIMIESIMYLDGGKELEWFPITHEVFCGISVEISIRSRAACTKAL